MLRVRHSPKTFVIFLSRAQDSVPSQFKSINDAIKIFIEILNLFLFYCFYCLFRNVNEFCDEFNHKMPRSSSAIVVSLNMYKQQ